ncbi:MAG: MOSC domain-containing protein [Rhodospirillaceae bacterium]|nr:MOSC domain-containing protein [Rhodospirillaceae bacterium]
MQIAAIYRYPVKGLSPESLPDVVLSAGAAVPQDRRFAITHGATRFDAAAPQWLAKTNFLMLMRNERLARLKTRFDDVSNVLTVERDGKIVCRANLSQAGGRMMLEQVIAALLGTQTQGAPRLVEAPGHVFSDDGGAVVSLINLASVRDLERVVRAPVDPLRFRGNVHVEGGVPWQEFTWIDRVLAIGPTRLKVQRRIRRCAATNVDPVTARRDLNLPLSLQEGFGHTDMGVYAEVVVGGAIKPGDELTPV